MLFAIAVVWVVASLAVALLIGRTVRAADHHAPVTDHLIGLPTDLTVADVLGNRVVQPSR